MTWPEAREALDEMAENPPLHILAKAWLTGGKKKAKMLDDPLLAKKLLEAPKPKVAQSILEQMDPELRPFFQTKEVKG